MLKMCKDCYSHNVCCRILKTILVIVAFVIMIFVFMNGHKKYYSTHSKLQIQSSSQSLDRIAEIENEILSINIIIPITEQEQRLVALKTELLQYVEKIKQEEVEREKESEKKRKKIKNDRAFAADSTNPIKPTVYPSSVKKLPPKISSKVSPYLQDDVSQLKEGMTPIQVDKIWGEPDSISRYHSGDNISLSWRYGQLSERYSKLKGIFYYKCAYFENNKLSCWIEKCKIKIWWHDRDKMFKNYLDTGSSLVKGMTKLEVYKHWGLPIKIEINHNNYSGANVVTKWSYGKNDSHFYHHASFADNKLYKWVEY